MFWILIIAACTLGSLCTATPCVPFNKAECLQSIRDIAQDDDRFFFGKSYWSKCPKTTLPLGTCELDSPMNKSMVSMLFAPGTFDPQTIDRFINVEFYSEPGSYKACDGTFTTTTGKTIVLDPSSDVVHKPWDLRDAPKITWDAEPGHYYTVVMQDVGFKFFHGVYINIEGNNFDEATEIKPYSYPKNSRNVTNPYIIILLDQGEKRIDLNEAWRNKITSDWPMFNISDLRDNFQMKGPIAMNWMLVGLDPYSVTSLEFLENCAYFVQETYATHYTPFTSSKPTFSVYMRVHFLSYDLAFQYCCENYFMDEKRFFIDPINNKTQTPDETRTGNKVTVVLNMNKMFPHQEKDFEGKLYTILSIDPDVPNPSYGTKSRPLVHWIAHNGVVKSNGALEFSESLYGWKGPMPPDNKPHEYYFLLYEQKEEIYFPSLKPEYSDPECRGSERAGTCLFNVDYFAEANDLKLVSVSWFIAENNAYVNKTRGVDEYQVCPEKLPCPEQTDASIKISASITVVCFVTTVMMMMMSLM